MSIEIPDDNLRIAAENFRGAFFLHPGKAGPGRGLCAFPRKKTCFTAPEKAGSGGVLGVKAEPAPKEGLSQKNYRV